MALPMTGTDRDLVLLTRAVNDLAAKAKFPVTFGGLATDEGATLSSYSGTIGRSIHGLIIEPQEGLGGRALLTRAPTCAVNYERTAFITHRYQREVSAEGICTLVAIPIIVDGAVRAVIYGGHRSITQLGNETMTSAMKAAQKMSWGMSVQDEVERRLAAVEPGRKPADRESAPTDPSTAREQYAELREIAAQIGDPEIRLRLDAVGKRLIARDAPLNAVGAELLSPREIDVLALVALGLRNAQVARRLDLEESTVKAYVSSAMRKLSARSRFEAVLKARAGGAIP